MKEIKWGFIGCGNVVENKSGPSFNTAENSSIYAVMRRDIEKAESSAKKLGATKWYNTVDNLVNDEEVNAVYIATPPGLHLEQATKCCLAKKATYIEKPFARNYREALKIVDMYREAGVSLYVAHYRRALPKFIKVKELIDSGVIGKVCEVDFRLNRKFNRQEALETWLYNTEISGGGKFYDIAPHAIDIMVYLFGNFVDIKGIATNNNEEYKVEDVVTMIFKTEKGIVGTANFNAIALDKKDSVIVNGTKGRIEFSIHGDVPIVITTSNSKETIEIKDPKVIQDDMVRNVVESLLTGEHLNTCSGEEALETSRIMDEVLKDYYNGREDEFWNRMDTWNK